MGYCVNCGNQIADGAKFCTNCGAPQQPHMQAPASQTQEPVFEQPWQPAAETASHQAYDSGDSYEDTAGSTDFDSAFGTSGVYGTDGSSASYGESGDGSAYGSGASYSSGYSTGSTNSNSSSAYSSGSTYSEGSGSSAGTYGLADTSNPVPAPGFQEAVMTCFSKYATFSGRARRSEYWYFTLFMFVANLLLGQIGNMIFGAPPVGQTNFLQKIFTAVVLIPSIAVTWRRLHDINKSGLWYFLILLPVIGWIILFVFEIRDSEPGENEYGMSPKYPGR